MKRAACVILCLLCVLMAARGFAEGDYVYYSGGGVIERGSARTRALLSELNVAYLDFDQPFLTTGQSAAWAVTASGGDGDYEYMFELYYREGAQGPFYFEKRQTRSGNNAFEYVPLSDSGHYLLMITLYDSTGAYLVWQSQVFEVASAAAQSNTNTVPGMVRHLAQRCVSEAGSSDYSRALWLHDYLIYNADYDHSQNAYSYADGVLLYGRGVCQSYALAYDMLLKAVGIDCVYVTGEAYSSSGVEPHAWNIVKLDGDWCHVDCTWDDPGTGGQENHSYFGLTDALMARDHVWTYGKGVLPGCDEDEYFQPARAGYTLVDSAEELTRALDDMVASGCGYAEFFYTGDDTYFNMVNEVRKWIQGFDFHTPFAAYNYSMGAMSGRLLLNYGSGYPDMNQAQYVNMDAETIVLFAGDAHKVHIDTLPDSAGVAGISWHSDDERVATVTDGRVTALAPGYARVTAVCANGRTDALNVYVNPTTALRVPEGVTVINDFAFANCAALCEVWLPSSLKTIGAGAFSGCADLLKITIPEGVEHIADDAFSGCEHVTIHCEPGSAAHEYALLKRIPALPIEQ